MKASPACWPPARASHKTATALQRARNTPATRARHNVWRRTKPMSPRTLLITWLLAILPLAMLAPAALV
jgi:hypothetical protein